MDSRSLIPNGIDSKTHQFSMNWHSNYTLIFLSVIYDSAAKSKSEPQRAKVNHKEHREHRDFHSISL
jgi:hypothetical protein